MSELLGGREANGRDKVMGEDEGKGDRGRTYCWEGKRIEALSKRKNG